MEVGCLRHLGASTIGSQLWDEDCSLHDGWQILTTKPPRSKRNKHPSQGWNRGMREGKGVKGQLPRRWAATTKKTQNTSCTYAMLQSTSMWNSNTNTYVSTLLTTGHTQVLFVVNSVKLHLIHCILKNLMTISLNFIHLNSWNPYSIISLEPGRKRNPFWVELPLIGHYRE